MSLVKVIIGNLLFFGIASIYNTRLPIIVLFMLIYVFPVIFNMSLIKKNKKEMNNLKIALSIFTTICYFSFGIIMMSQPNFNEYISNNTLYMNDAYIEISRNFIHITQLIFVFLLNFGFMSLLQLFGKEE
ncbi:Msa family membrane protein [Enterococcus cecorum]|uniref:Msa family membrane protein n=1 Tax=Enterococcus cecorum TaxID=44008 RepID=UPI001FAC6966|nr:Msa family membrane protein [uncultured Enterococcus sp.]MCJ0537653.1 Msa family membrane protein [Enterococcus cecorum]MCJ0545531.1 Msa family membrane protein [Enterococcus cecorum]